MPLANWGVFATTDQYMKHQDYTTADLAESLLESGWTLRLRVSGSSMKPLLTGESLLRIGPVSDASNMLKRGHIVAFRTSGDRLVIHRIVDCDARRVRTKGDSSGEADPAVERSQILGLILGIDEPFFIPLTGALACRIGLALNRYYPRIVHLKSALRRIFLGTPELAEEKR